MILTVGGEKGGVGKSTLAVHLAYMLASSGRDPLLIDADPQGVLRILRRRVTSAPRYPDWLAFRNWGRALHTTFGRWQTVTQT